MAINGVYSIETRETTNSIGMVPRGLELILRYGALLSQLRVYGTHGTVMYHQGIRDTSLNEMMSHQRRDASMKYQSTQHRGVVHTPKCFDMGDDKDTVINHVTINTSCPTQCSTRGSARSTKHHRSPKPCLQL